MRGGRGWEREEERGRGGRGGGEYKITGGHWPFSVHCSKVANQNINQCSPQEFLKV